MVGYKYMSPEVLAGFDKYKYNSLDTSPLGKYVTHPFWNWVVEFCPVWIAPNLLTFMGFLMLLAQFALLSYYDYSFYAADNTHPDYPLLPRRVWIMSAFFMFAAHTLDGIDGKQARKTKTSSALGELFDHGIDSWATVFIPLAMYTVFGRGDYSIEPARCYFVFLSVMITFLLTHWEKYNTGVLYLPWAYDVSQIIMTALYVVGFTGGHNIFKFTTPILDITSGNLFEGVMHFAVFGVSLPVSIWNVYSTCSSGKGKNLGYYEGARPLIPAFILFVLFVTWAFNSSINIAGRDPRLFYFCSGTVFSNITCRLIVNGMSHTRCQVFNWLLVPLLAIVAGVLLVNLGQIELYLLWTYTVLVTASHIHYGSSVVQQLADHLNINVFSIQKRAAK